MSAMQSGSRCEVCRFFRPKGPSFGNCQRHSPIGFRTIRLDDDPRSLEKDEAIWPETQIDDFCGDFQCQFAEELRDNSP